MMPTVSFFWIIQNEPYVNSKKSSKKAVSNISIFTITITLSQCLFQGRTHRKRAVPNFKQKLNHVPDKMQSKHWVAS